MKSFHKHCPFYIKQNQQNTHGTPEAKRVKTHFIYDPDISQHCRRQKQTHKTHMQTSRYAPRRWQIASAHWTTVMIPHVFSCMCFTVWRHKFHIHKNRALYPFCNNIVEAMCKNSTIQKYSVYVTNASHWRCLLLLWHNPSFALY